MDICGQVDNRMKISRAPVLAQLRVYALCHNADNVIIKNRVDTVSVEVDCN